MFRRVGKAVQQRRRRHGCSRDVLAHKLGVSVRTLARLEMGELDPRLGLLLTLETIFPGLLPVLTALRGPRRGRGRPGLAKIRREP